MSAKMAVALSDTFRNKSRTELIEEIMRLNKEMRTKSQEIAMLKKRLLIYKSIK
jgi:hypothetical protein